MQHKELVVLLKSGRGVKINSYFVLSVVCQEGNYGPLIISEFAGTYASFGAALRINPWDSTEVSDAIHEALVMNDEEKQNRWQQLYAYIDSNTG